MLPWRLWGAAAEKATREKDGGVNLTMLEKVRERLQAYNAESEETYVEIEHQMEIVMAQCTRELVVAEGRIIAEGAPQDSRTQPGRDRSLSRTLKDMAGPSLFLSLDGVFAGYGKMTILNGTTARIRRGAITTVIGPNGAGKSTMFKTVFGLLPVRAGTITFDGRRIDEFLATRKFSMPASPTSRKAATSSRS